MLPKSKIVFMGSPDFALHTLQALHENYSVVGVVTQPDRAAGRGRELKSPPVKTLAFELGIPVIQPEKLRQPEAMEQLRAWSPDVIVVAAFGQILKQDVLDLPPFGCINVHASLLPRWRGAAPINAAILHGDEETGISIMKMDAGLDTGPILSQRSVRIQPDETAGSLFETLSQLGADLLLEALPRYLAGEIEPRPQPEEGVTYAPMLKKEDGALDFSRPAEELERKVRAFNPWPGTYFEWGDNLLKVHKARTAIVFTYMFQQPGTRTIYDGLPAIYGGDNMLLVLEEVQPAGKKAMPGKAFLAGARNWFE
jgi:methionyl-tRNA formyltransferase